MDPVATKTPEDPYIEVASLDQWAKGKYKIAIFKNDVDRLVKDSTWVKTEAQEEEDASQLRPGVDKVKTNNLYVLLAFFVEAFASTATHYRKNDEPNASNIAAHFAAVITASNYKNSLSAHTADNIRRVISEAMLRKRQKQLKKSYVNGVLEPIVEPILKESDQQGENEC